MSMIFNIDDLVYDDILAYPYDHMIPNDDDDDDADDNYYNIIGNDNGGIISPPSSPRRPAMPYNFNVIYIEIPDENDNNLTHDTSILKVNQENSIENDHDAMEDESNDDDDRAGHNDTEENDIIFLTSSSSHTASVKTFIELDDDMILLFMDQNNSQQNEFNHESTDLTPPLTANNIPRQQRNHTVRMASSQPVPFAFWANGMSQASIDSEENATEELFDKIEQLICEYMQEPHRHYLHCRVLRWCVDDNPSSLFTSVIVINPPTNNH
ncbi:unnamed protein product [Rotaria magnacalcarata]|uniref:Uncharacterized protein n=6 Tax=Rotaria magnacalcarata TaxID=392030 RepID=A0A818ZCI3_9BILA|nr:unnamed protein product [Rotaria magnacalcarata]